MRHMRSMAVAGCTLLTASLAAGAALTPAAAAGDKPPVVKLKGSKTALTVSKTSVRPGAVQFQVVKTMPDDPNNGPDGLSVFKAKDIDKVLAQIPKLFSEDPDAGPSMAAAVTYLREHATIYGGGHKGTTWQVVLPKGTYYAVSLNSAGAGSPITAKFTVKGKNASAALHDTAATVTAAKPNRWKTKGLDSLGSGWLTYRNTSKELHFMELSGVKPGTKDSQVKQAFQDPNAEPDFFTKKSFFFDVISPGIEVAVKGPVKKSRYLLDCFMPSESDGMPHAFMGMWKLVDVA